jgi:hypothetical protein
LIEVSALLTQNATFGLPLAAVVAVREQRNQPLPTDSIHAVAPLPTLPTTPVEILNQVQHDVVPE